MNNILITGVGGMVGSHLADYFAVNVKDKKVLGTYYKPTTNIEAISSSTVLVECDVRYFQTVLDVISSSKPEKIFHLAAQSFPSVSWKRPQETCDVNVTGTINIFEAIKEVRKNDIDYDPVVVVACSSAEYGQSMIDLNGDLDESAPLLPLSPYGVSKVAQDLLAYQYFKCDDIKSIRARIFNTTGPRKVGDVLADFTKRATMVKNKKESKFLVGNINTERAITDVRDLIGALVLLADKGRPGEAYNICGKTKYKISDLIRIIEAEIGVDLSPTVDSELLRPTDEKVIFGDSSKLIADTGWSQKISIETTIKDMLQHWNTVLSSSK